MRNGVIPEPPQNLIGAFVWRKHGIENVLNSAVLSNQGESRILSTLKVGRRNASHIFERKVKTARHLTLIFAHLSADHEHRGFEQQ
jgi:hypothetical protein